MGTAPLTVIVDGANVVGARPDGWWRDRAGAARRLRRELEALAARGVVGLPRSPGEPAGVPVRFTLVVEGAARAAAAGWPSGEALAADGQPAGGPSVRGPSASGQVAVVAASGSGDDTIAGLAAELGDSCLVVTSDRELRGRCAAAGAQVTGVSWLLRQL